MPKPTKQPAFISDLLEAISQCAIIAVDLQGKIVAWNDGARQAYGYDAEELVGRGNVSVLQVSEGDGVASLQTLFDSATSSGKAERVTELMGKDGQRRLNQLTVTTRRDGGGIVTGYLLLASLELSKHTVRDSEVQSGADNLEHLGFRATELPANLAHDLRSPLNAIIGFTELVYEGMAGPVTDEQKEDLEIVVTSARRLLDLINRVFDPEASAS